MKKLLVIVGLLAALSACNTVDGLGQDISAGARAVGAGLESTAGRESRGR